MKSLKTSDWIAISGFFLVVTFLSLWGIDISVSALLANGYLTNGFFNSNPTRIYHIGLYIISLSCFCNFLIVIHLLLRSGRFDTGNDKKTLNPKLDIEKI